MKIVYAREEIAPQAGGLFLAGPTPRSADVKSWRPEALSLLEAMGYTGTVYVPEAANWQPHDDYSGQIEWEWAALDAADKIIFWVPRNLQTMPALTTNVEFGLYVKSGKAILGYPPEAEKMRYLDALAKRFSVPVFSSLEQMLKSLNS